MKDKIFAVNWTERHQTYVKAKDKQEAIEKAWYEENWLCEDNVDMGDEGVIAEEMTEDELKAIGFD
ncbi:MAG: hypothetical protein KBH94_06160 [Caldisericia bacterium]|nr:hypothetical protein [Caldisericia bacterium]